MAGLRSATRGCSNCSERLYDMLPAVYPWGYLTQTFVVVRCQGEYPRCRWPTATIRVSRRTMSYRCPKCGRGWWWFEVREAMLAADDPSYVPPGRLR